jgi:hypothetical protein
MGYESHWSGEIRITPPLTWTEIRQSPFVQDVKLRLDEQIEDTPTGQVRTVTTAAIEPLVTGQAFNGYAIEEELQAVINAHPDHHFSGAIVARPLDPDGTPWRYVVTPSALTDQKVIRQEPRIVWPDGTEVDQ